MAYIGIGPASFTNNLTNVQILDDISGDFDGNTATFDLTSNDIPFQAVSDRALMVILGGVIQAPGVDYTINLAQITFTTNPISGLTFYARNIYGLNALNKVNDGIVGPYSLTTGAPSWDSSGNTTISGNLTVQGATTTIQSTTLDVIDKDIKLASNQSTNAGIDTAGLLWGTTAVKLKYYNNGGTNPGLNIEGTNVGINTTAPTEKLDVSGSIKLAGDIKVDTGSLSIINNANDEDVVIKSDNSSGGVTQYIRADGSTGETLLYHYGTEKIKTTSSGVAISGEGTFSGGLFADSDLWMVDQLRHTGDTNTAIRFPAADVISFERAGSEALRITTAGALLTAGVTAEPLYPHYTTARKIQAEIKGALDVGQTRHHGSLAVNCTNSNSFIGLVRSDNTQTDGTGIGVIGWSGFDGTDYHQAAAIEVVKGAGAGNDDQPGHMIFKTNAGTNLATERLRIKSDGNLKVPDNVKIEFGGVQTGAGDLEIYHGGTASYISHSGTGNLYIHSNTVALRKQNQETYFLGQNGAASLYKDGNQKIITSDTGITVTGEVAATQDYPTVRPTLDLNFVATNKLDSRVKFFRNSHATYIDKDGIVRIVGDNTPRFDYDPETKECLGLLMEGSSSSRLTQSSHNTAGVGLYHQIMTDNYYKGPDDIEGSAREYIHRGDSGSATGGSTSIWANQAIGIANPVSVSLFVKITRGSSMGFELLDNNNSLNSHRVDISGGYISDGSYATVSTNNPGNSEGTTSYQRFPNGWVKIKWENISGSGNTTTYMQLYLQNHATSTAVNPVGYAVWGFQVENEAFCTSTIIKNRTDVAAERGREVAIIDKEHFADFWNPLEGTAYVDALMPHSYSNSGIPAFSIKHTVNTSHSLGFFRDNGSSPVWHFFNDGAGVTARTAGASDFRYRSALAFKEADINGAINGVASMNQTSAFTMQKFDYMYLGSINTADNDLHGHLKRFTYYPKKLSDNQLLNITS